MRKSIERIILVLGLLGAATAGEAGKDTPYRGEFAAENVLVVVDMAGGSPDRLLHVGMSAAGQVQVRNAYADTTVVRFTVPADTALAFIDDLLSIDFFGQPERFEARYGVAEFTEAGTVGVMSVSEIDGDFASITLHLGPRSHAVALIGPAFGAPQALRDWVGRFRLLLKDARPWLMLPISPDSSSGSD